MALLKAVLSKVRAPRARDGVLTDHCMCTGIDAFFPGPYYCFYELPTPDQVQEAYDFVTETIEEEGPFDGIIGFSQGGALASSYILNDLSSPKPQNPFKCAIFFCASMPFDRMSRTFCVNKDGTCRFADDGQPMTGFDVTQSIPETASAGWSGTYDEKTEFLHRYTSVFANPRKTKITIPTTHIVGASDAYHDQGCSLRDLCAKQGRHFFEHRGGHEIPTDRNTTSKMASTIQNMLHDVLVG